jgi:uncharacterized protein
MQGSGKGFPANTIIGETLSFVRKSLTGAEGGHDWFHTERVWKMAKHLREKEGRGDPLIIELAALLHDISDPKFNGGDQQRGSLMAYDFLIARGLDRQRAEHIRDIVQHVSFRGGVTQQVISTIEFQIVQDADRLDAMGAIGIARAFNYGGFRNRPLYDPAVPPREYDHPSAYHASGAPTINHFHEKLLRLKDLMNTPSARSIAEKRHRFMVHFLERFLGEWGPPDS